ncbi:MAG TPA: hypothetical protein VMG41_00495 [Gemmatimonadales bacterium]|nr:hypothetical protein [Gemmatimonadales bacterium]
MMTDWATTHRLAVRVTLAEGLVIQGDVHLQPRVAWRDGPETPIELLNRGEAFFPMTLPNGDIVFVAKEQVAVLGYPAVVAFDDPERKVAARMIPLEVMMVGGHEHRGIAVSELPPTRSRALDFLNAPERFFQLLTDEGTLCLNRRFVRATRPLS